MLLGREATWESGSVPSAASCLFGSDELIASARTSGVIVSVISVRTESGVGMYESSCTRVVPVVYACVTCARSRAGAGRV